jgi:ferritin-like metal-binding protein YciE
MATKEKAKRKPATKATHPTNTNEENISMGQPALMEFFVSGIRDIYWAENHLVMALPKMRKASSSAELQKAIDDHLEVTKGHVARLEQIFQLLDQKALAQKCDAMEGLTLEGEGNIEDTIEGTPVRDLAVNVSCQKVEHYEIAAYTSLASLAGSLGYPEVQELLTTTLQEEEDSAELLSSLSNDITERALSETGA